MSKILANQIANYSDDSPIEIKEGLNIPAGKPLQAAGDSGTNGQVLSSTGSTVEWTTPFDGNYNSLTNRPTIPAAQVRADWNAVGSVAEILNKPTIPAQPSVVINPSPSGSGNLSYSSGNGQFTFTQPDLSAYLTSFTEIDPVFSASPASDILLSDITNWDTAYGWGNHASAGYVTGLDMEDLGNVDISGGLSDQQVLKWNATNSAWEPANDLVGGAQGIQFVDLSVTTAPAGTAALSYNNTNGVFTFTPPNLSGYLTSFTETDPVFAASPAANVTLSKINQWDTAYSWGNHANGGYLTAESDTLATVTARGATTTSAISVGRVDLGDAVGNLTTGSGYLKLGASDDFYLWHYSQQNRNQITNQCPIDIQSSEINLTNGSTSFFVGTNSYSLIRHAEDTNSASNRRLITEGSGTQLVKDLRITDSADANKFKFTTGESPELDIFINGTGTETLKIFGGSKEAYIRNIGGTGSGGGINIEGRSGVALYSNSHLCVWAKSTGEGVLLYQTAEKLTTTNTGVTVTGDLNFTGNLLKNGSSFSSVAKATISDTAPGSPSVGDLWWESDKGRLKIYYNDTDSSQWVDASPPLQQDKIATSAAPATASSTGTAGEIRYDSGYVYICVATNTWKRAALTTW